MPDFSNMSIVEIGNYLSELRENMPQSPSQVFANGMSVLLAEFNKQIQ